MAPISIADRPSPSRVVALGERRSRVRHQLQRRLELLGHETIQRLKERRRRGARSALRIRLASPGTESRRPMRRRSARGMKRKRRRAREKWAWISDAGEVRRAVRCCVTSSRSVMAGPASGSGRGSTRICTAGDRRGRAHADRRGLSREHLGVHPARTQGLTRAVSQISVARSSLELTAQAPSGRARSRTQSGRLAPVP